MKRMLLVFVGIFVLALPSMGMGATVLKGTVLENGSGSPVLASVLAYKQNDSGGWDFTGAEQTANDGSFSFNNLGAGTFYLECDAYTDCNPQDFYCADKYLPQYYNKVPLYKFDNKTVLTLQEGDVKALDTMMVKTRPFYFDTVSNSCAEARADGLVKITSKVVNTTGHDRWMLFFGVMDSPRRQDHSRYNGLAGSYPLGGWNWKLLKPGVNTVTLTHKVITTTLKGKYEYWIVGGDSVELPMTPYLEGWICHGSPPIQNASESSPVVTGTDERGATYGRGKTIPLKISAEGEILETGPMPR